MDADGGDFINANGDGFITAHDTPNTPINTNKWYTLSAYLSPTSLLYEYVLATCYIFQCVVIVFGAIVSECLLFCHYDKIDTRMLYVMAEKEEERIKVSNTDGTEVVKVNNGVGNLEKVS